MARETINIGVVANDGTGDTFRIAGQKINNNFAELYTTFAPTELGDRIELTGNNIVATLEVGGATWEMNTLIPLQTKRKSLNPVIT